MEILAGSLVSCDAKWLNSTRSRSCSASQFAYSNFHEDADLAFDVDGDPNIAFIYSVGTPLTVEFCQTFHLVANFFEWVVMGISSIIVNDRPDSIFRPHQALIDT
jgi:hypothetical protein